MREHKKNRYSPPLNLTCCMYCGHKKYSIMEEDHENGETDLPFYAECPECHARGPAMPTMEKAADYWENAVWRYTSGLPARINQRFMDDVLEKCE